MSTDLANFLFEAVNFLLLAAGLGFVLFKPVRAALDAEKRAHAEAEEALAAEREALEKGKAELDARERGETQRREAADAEARAAFERDRDREREEARAAAEAARARLETELEAQRRAEVERLAEDVGRLTARSVSALLAHLEGPALDEALLGGALEELRRLGVESATVESARPLSEDARRAIAAAVPSFEARVDPALGAGVRITTEAGQVDATAISIAREAARQTRDAMRARQEDPHP